MQVAGYGDPEDGDAVPAGQANLLALVYATVVCKRIAYEIELLEALQQGAAASGGGGGSAPPGGLVGLPEVPVVRRTADGREVALVQRENPKAAEELAGCRGVKLPRPLPSPGGGPSLLSPPVHFS